MSPRVGSTSPLSLPPLMPDMGDDSPSIGFLTPRHSPPTYPRIIDSSSHYALAQLTHSPNSPPLTPKGHPFRPVFTRQAPNVSRIPRRLRPVSLFIFCFCVVGVVFLTRALSSPTDLDIVIAQRKAFASERRIVHLNGLVNINAPPARFTFSSEKDELLALINVSHLWNLTDPSSSPLPQPTLFPHSTLTTHWTPLPFSTLTPPIRTRNPISTCSRRKSTHSIPLFSLAR